MEKNEMTELEATKELLYSMFTGFFNANDFFAYACAWGVTITEEDFPWIIEHIQKHPSEGIYPALAYIQNMEPIRQYINDSFNKALQELIERKQEVASDFDYGDQYNKNGPYRTIKED